MKRPPKLVLLLVAGLCVTAAPSAGSAGQKFRVLSSSQAGSLQSANSNQSSPMRVNRSVQVNRFALGNILRTGQSAAIRSRLQTNRSPGTLTVRPNVTLPQNATGPATVEINRDAIRNVAPSVATPALRNVRPLATGQSQVVPNGLKFTGKLSTEAQSLAKNLIAKDRMLTVRKDLLTKHKDSKFSNLPQLQQAKKYAQKCLPPSPKCGWWLPWYYHCYWHTCHCWCWDYWYPCHFYVIPCHAAYSYYLGAELFAVPGMGLGVAAINPGSPAERAGLAVGDMILSANGCPLQTLNSRNVMKNAIQTSGGVLRMEVLKENSDQPVLRTAFLQPIYHYAY